MSGAGALGSYAPAAGLASQAASEFGPRILRYAADQYSQWKGSRNFNSLKSGPASSVGSIGYTGSYGPVTRSRVMKRQRVEPAVVLTPRKVGRNVMGYVPRDRFGAARYESRVREIKYCDMAQSSSAFRIASTPPAFVAINFPVQGAAPYNRVGSKVMNRSIRIRGYINNLLTSINDVGRIIIVYDRQTNGAAPAWGDVIAGVTSAGAASTNALDGINMSNRERFKVLCDEQVLLPSITDAGGAGVLTNVAALDTSGPSNKFNFDRFIPLRNLETHYKATAGAVGDIATGGIFIATVSNAIDSAWQFSYTSRLRFDDL